MDWPVLGGGAPLRWCAPAKGALPRRPPLNPPELVVESWAPAPPRPARMLVPRSPLLSRRGRVPFPLCCAGATPLYKQ